MGQNFIADTVNQTLLFPPSLHDWLPEGHLARFLVEVVSALDLDAIYKSYQDKDGRGQAAYAPEMMVRLLLYGYARGVYSSRKIQTRTHEDVAFRSLSGDQHPDHATIAEFRKRHLEALSGLFTQALLLCEKAGLVKLGHVSINGSKIKANASKHKAMSYNAQIAANLDRKPEKVSADAGYFSELNVSDAQVNDVDLYVATSRDKHGDATATSAATGSDLPPPGASPKEAMREKLRTAAGRAVYERRKAIVEPVFGEIKEQRGFRRFSLRGKENVSREWKLVCAASNLLKLFRAGWVLETA